MLIQRNFLTVNKVLKNSVINEFMLLFKNKLEM